MVCDVRECDNHTYDPRPALRSGGWTVVLAGDVSTMAELARRNPTLVREVNLGGIHHRPGRTKRLPYLTILSLSWMTTMSSSNHPCTVP